MQNKIIITIVTTLMLALFSEYVRLPILNSGCRYLIIGSISWLFMVCFIVKTRIPQTINWFYDYRILFKLLSVIVVSIILITPIPTIYYCNPSNECQCDQTKFEIIIGRFQKGICYYLGKRDGPQKQLFDDINKIKASEKNLDNKYHNIDSIYVIDKFFASPKEAEKFVGESDGKILFWSDNENNNVNNFKVNITFNVNDLIRTARNQISNKIIAKYTDELTNMFFGPTELLRKNILTLPASGKQTCSIQDKYEASEIKWTIYWVRGLFSLLDEKKKYQAYWDIKKALECMDMLPGDLEKFGSLVFETLYFSYINQILPAKPDTFILKDEHIKDWFSCYNELKMEM